MLSNDACGVQSTCVWVDMAVDDICREYMGGEGVGVADKVGQGDGWQGVVVGVGVVEEFDHCG